MSLAADDVAGQGKWRGECRKVYAWTEGEKKPLWGPKTWYLGKGSCCYAPDAVNFEICGDTVLIVIVL